MSCLQSNAFLNKILYLCVTGLSRDNKASISSTTNWNKSRSNCKDPLSTVNNATDMCVLNKDNVKTGRWTNIFRVEISSHVDPGNTFHNDMRIYLFILQ
jgi:hypothetical protein